MTRKKLAKTIMRKWFIVFFALCLTLTGLVFVSQPVSSQSLNGVLSEVRTLRSRIGRLESEVRNLRSSTSRISRPNVSSRQKPVTIPAPNRNRSSLDDDRVVDSSDPMFKRLATLVIELKEEVRAMEKRLVILEQKNS